MARPQRFAAPGMAQHVIQRGNNRSICFVAPADYRFYLECLADACAEFECQVHAYVLMTNHVHLLMSPATPSGVSSVMQAIGRRYIRRFNDSYHRTGTLWEGRHKATIVDREQYLFACYRYVELNPLRAGLSATARAYRWSSHRANAYRVADSLITSHERYVALGDTPRVRQRVYRALFTDPIPDATLSEIRDATNRGWALGGKHFRAEVAAMLRRRTEPAIKGRRAAMKR